MIAALTIGGFALAACGALARLVVGPSLADRVAALDVALVSLMAAIAVAAAHTGSAAMLDLLVVVAIVGFTATVAASRFIEHDHERGGGDR